jgi:hypothetical protein
MTWILRVFSLIVKLYPQPFQARFSEEMEEVFHTGLVEAGKQGESVRFILRELLYLPGSLVGVYIWSMRAGEGRSVAVSSVGGGGTVGVPMPGEGFGASLIGGLPHLLIGGFIVLSTIISAMEGINQNSFGYLSLSVFLLLLLGVVVYGFYKGWKRWSTSWLIYLFIFAIAMLSTALNSLIPSIRGRADWLNTALLIIIPLLLAYLLYKITCKDRLRGLLAAIPPMVIIWAYFEELVPTLPKTLAWAWLFILAFTCTFLMLRTKSFSAALGLAFLVPILGGFPFAYLGVYLGGTLPFSEPGPSIQEVIRQYIPFLVMVLSIVLGPQLAVKLRMIGYECAKAGGRIFYRLALGGILLGLLYSLLQSTIATSGVTISSTYLKILLITALVLYLVGFALLVWATYRSKLPSSDNSIIVELASLFLPLLFLPAVILMTLIADSYVKNWLQLLAEMAWVIALALAEIAWVTASTLVVKD